MIFEIADEQIERLHDMDLRTMVCLLCEEKVRATSLPQIRDEVQLPKTSGGVIYVRVSFHENAAIVGYGPRAGIPPNHSATAT